MAAPRHRWVVFGGLVGVYFSFGVAVAAIAPMLSLVRADLDASRGEMGLALGAWALVYIATAPIAGRFIDRFDLGWSLFLGGCSVVGSLLLRAMAQAAYGVDNVGHFALASKAYVHFTSPIRRYPDLVVHRVLRAGMQHRLSPTLKETEDYLTGRFG